MTETEPDYDVIPVPTELLEAVSHACNGKSLQDITAVAIIMASRTLVLGSGDMNDLGRAVLEFCTAVHDETLALAEKMGVGETRQ